MPSSLLQLLLLFRRSLILSLTQLDYTSATVVLGPGLSKRRCECRFLAEMSGPATAAPAAMAVVIVAYSTQSH